MPAPEREPIPCPGHLADDELSGADAQVWNPSSDSVGPAAPQRTTQRRALEDALLTASLGSLRVRAPQGLPRIDSLRIDAVARTAYRPWLPWCVVGLGSGLVGFG